MEEIEWMEYERPIWDKNRYETGYSKNYEMLYLEVMEWAGYRFDNHPMAEVELAGKICEGMTLMERMRGYDDWNKLSLNGFLYGCRAYDLTMNNHLLSLSGNLRGNYWISRYESDKEDVEEENRRCDWMLRVKKGSWSYGFLEQNWFLKEVVDKLTGAHQAIIDTFENLVDSMSFLLEEKYKEMNEAVDWKRMMNEQYRHYYVTEGRGKIQELNLKLQMMDEGERMEWAKGKKMELVERIGKTRLGEVHNRCCDIYGRNWDGERFVEEYKGLEDWDFGEILNYMVDITEWRFLNCVLEGRAFVDEENFVVEKNGETTVGVEDKVAEKGDVAVEKNGETAEKEGDSETEENGETVEEELGRIFGELMMNLEGYMKRPYRAKGVAEVVKRVLKRGNETELGGELVELLQARKREHHIGRMSVNHFFRLIKLLKENGMVDGCGKPVSEMVKDGLGRYWVSEFDKAFNKCFSTSWDKFRGQRYPHIGLNLIDELKRGR